MALAVDEPGWVCGQWGLTAACRCGGAPDPLPCGDVRLDVAGMQALLLKLDFMQRIARGEAAVAEDG